MGQILVYLLETAGHTGDQKLSHTMTSNGASNNLRRPTPPGSKLKYCSTSITEVTRAVKEEDGVYRRVGLVDASN